MSEMEFRLITTMPLIPEVGKEMQSLLEAVYFLRMRCIIDLNSVSKNLLYPSDEASGERIGIPFTKREKLRKRPISRL